MNLILALPQLLGNRLLLCCRYVVVATELAMYCHGHDEVQSLQPERWSEWIRKLVFLHVVTTRLAGCT